ncbi:DUF268 domain-containing protein [Primorskyibacter sp. S87]|uniref:DUF268 domain-containing protein n=1 Tax=Primorskyibacter sp. S87 TaxID=3415126 RepID=UPI003C7E8FFB
MVQRRECGVYGGIDKWLYEALEQFPINGMRVAVIGSADQGFGPWYECICIQLGAQPITVEYNPIDFNDTRFTFVHAEQVNELDEKFDAAFSISSFEHDGLGRYGDPLSADADLNAMRRWRNLIKPGGRMYLAVPIGLDKIVYNSNRIYGRKRFPELIDGWEVEASFGFEGLCCTNPVRMGLPLSPDGFSLRLL